MPHNDCQTLSNRRRRDLVVLLASRYRSDNPSQMETSPKLRRKSSQRVGHNSRPHSGLVGMKQYFGLLTERHGPLRHCMARMSKQDRRATSARFRDAGGLQHRQGRLGRSLRSPARAAATLAWRPRQRAVPKQSPHAGSIFTTPQKLLDPQTSKTTIKYLRRSSDPNRPPAPLHLGSTMQVTQASDRETCRSSGTKRIY